VIAAVRRTERLTPIRVVALALALGGVTIMVGAPMTEKLNPLGVIFALASALLYSVYLPLLSHIQRGTPALASTFLLVSGAALAFVVAAWATGELYVPPDMHAWSNIFLLAFISTVVAFSTLIKGLSVLGAVRTAIIATVEPFFTAVLGVVVLGNLATVETILGGVLIASAVILIQWSSTRVRAIA
jgi:drug/metabolite transporter (DMT)-like permease